MLCNYLDLKSNTGYLGCQQLADAFNEILYSIQNEHIKGLYINEDKYQNKLFREGKLKKHWHSMITSI